MTLQGLRGSLTAIRDGLADGSIMRKVLDPRKDEIMTFQYQQLFDGKASNGEDIRPYYTEDLKPQGWFHSVESAQAYSRWKETGIPYPFKANRNPDAPNLYINGKFHSELECYFLPDTIVIHARTPYANQIVMKYGEGTFGLTAESWGEMLNERGVANDVMKYITNTINGNG